VYTWLSNSSGRSGVLSTVTMPQPYGREIAAQLIRLRKHGCIGFFVSTVNALLNLLKLLHFAANGQRIPRRGAVARGPRCEPSDVSTLPIEKFAVPSSINATFAMSGAGTAAYRFCRLVDAPE